MPEMTVRELLEKLEQDFAEVETLEVMYDREGYHIIPLKRKYREGGSHYKQSGSK